MKQRIEACPELVEGDAAYPRPLLMATTRTLRYGLRPTLRQAQDVAQDAGLYPA